MAREVESTVSAPKIFTKKELDKKIDPLLEDGGEVTLKCSNCDKPLVVVWRTRPNEKIGRQDIVWTLQAQCCYCGDKSFKKEIKGGFHYKGYDKPHPNGNPEDVIPIVNVSYPDTSGDVVLFITEKAKND